MFIYIRGQTKKERQSENHTCSEVLPRVLPFRSSGFRSLNHSLLRSRCSTRRSRSRSFASRSIFVVLAAHPSSVLVRCCRLVQRLGSKKVARGKICHSWREMYRVRVQQPGSHCTFSCYS